ncbi:hypothetical protein RHMOL_Rhmol10G0038400 [Rhododendron molle]|uniref:Uncharacterized protein n=1 Tax=Rhododendron molle TaxID=49168 RepID=A0ACC0M051_RHOML|nr:hypothetical protein RHMOL_Rhmol10G0038400 [Rhododendron molle]
MGRPPCCDKSNVKRGLWTPEEDAKILAYVGNNGVGNWTLVPQKAGLNRCGKSCRLRWTNYLRPDLKHDNFTPEEEQLILDFHQAIGSRWSLIAKQLPGRTDNDVKNHWNTKLKKKLSKMGIDPVTHKPFSQILSDYGKISSLPNTRNPIPSPNNMQVSVSGPTFLPMESSISKPFPQQFQDESFPNQPYFYTEISSSASSSSGSCSFPQLRSPQSFPCPQAQAPVITPPSPHWSTEFLVGDPIQSADTEKFSSAFSPQLSEVGQEKACEGMSSGGQKKHLSEAASSSASSFVEAILDRDSEMQMEFPEFMNEYFNY